MNLKIFKDAKLLKEKTDAGYLTYQPGRHGQTVATLYRQDDEYVMVGETGRHALNMAFTDAKRLFDHWEGFAEASVVADARRWEKL